MVFPSAMRISTSLAVRPLVSVVIVCALIGCTASANPTASLLTRNSRRFSGGRSGRRLFKSDVAMALLYAGGNGRDCDGIMKFERAAVAADPLGRLNPDQLGVVRMPGLGSARYLPERSSRGPGYHRLRLGRARRTPGAERLLVAGRAVAFRVASGDAPGILAGRPQHEKIGRAHV